MRRGKQSIALDLKDPAAIDLLLELMTKVDVLIEGFRTGVMERLGLGPTISPSPVCCITVAILTARLRRPPLCWVTALVVPR